MSIFGPRIFQVGDKVVYKTTMLPWVTIPGTVKSVSKDGQVIEVQWDDLMVAEIKTSNYRLSLAT